MESYGEALQQNLRVQSIPGIYAGEVCEKFSEIWPNLSCPEKRQS